VAASILFQGYAARLWSPLLGCVALGIPPPDLAAGRLRWRYRPGEPVGLNLAAPEPAAEPVPPVIVHDHLTPMIAALHRLTGVARNLLWGNASSALVGTLTALTLAGVRDGAAATVVRALLESAPLRGTGVLTVTDGRPSFRRRSCCLYYRLPGGGLCGDCCLTRVRRDQCCARQTPVTGTPTLASSRRVIGRLMPITFDGSPSTPSTNQPPSPSMVNPPATPSGSPVAR
jgi:FhuF-like iron-sulfur protein